MKINQEKEFKPITITLETQEDYVAFEQIIDEANRIAAMDKEFMGKNAINMAIRLSDYFSNDV